MGRGTTRRRVVHSAHDLTESHCEPRPFRASDFGVRFALPADGQSLALLVPGGRLQTDYRALGEDWAPVPLVDAPVAPFGLWVDAMTGGADVASNQRTAVELTRFVVAANEAAATGRAIDIEREQ